MVECALFGGVYDVGCAGGRTSSDDSGGNSIGSSPRIWGGQEALLMGESSSSSILSLRMNFIHASSGFGWDSAFGGDRKRFGSVRKVFLYSKPGSAGSTSP